MSSTEDRRSVASVRQELLDYMESNDQTMEDYLAKTDAKLEDLSNKLSGQMKDLEATITSLLRGKEPVSKSSRDSSHEQFREDDVQEVTGVDGQWLFHPKEIGEGVSVIHRAPWQSAKKESIPLWPYVKASAEDLPYTPSEAVGKLPPYRSDFVIHGREDPERMEKLQMIEDYFCVSRLAFTSWGRGLYQYLDGNLTRQWRDFMRRVKREPTWPQACAYALADMEVESLYMDKIGQFCEIQPTPGQNVHAFIDDFRAMETFIPRSLVNNGFRRLLLMKRLDIYFPEQVRKEVLEMSETMEDLYAKMFRIFHPQTVFPRANSRAGKKDPLNPSFPLIEEYQKTFVREQPGDKTLNASFVVSRVTRRLRASDTARQVVKLARKFETEGPEIFNNSNRLKGLTSKRKLRFNMKKKMLRRTCSR